MNREGPKSIAVAGWWQFCMAAAIVTGNLMFFSATWLDLPLALVGAAGLMLVFNGHFWKLELFAWQLASLAVCLLTLVFYVCAVATLIAAAGTPEAAAVYLARSVLLFWLLLKPRIQVRSCCRRCSGSAPVALAMSRNSTTSSRRSSPSYLAMKDWGRRSRRASSAWVRPASWRAWRSRPQRRRWRGLKSERVTAAGTSRETGGDANPLAGLSQYRIMRESAVRSTFCVPHPRRTL